MEVDIFITLTAGEGRMILLPNKEKDDLYNMGHGRLSREEQKKLDNKNNLLLRWYKMAGANKAHKPRHKDHR